MDKEEEEVARRKTITTTTVLQMEISRMAILITINCPSWISVQSRKKKRMKGKGRQQVCFYQMAITTVMIAMTVLVVIMGGEGFASGISCFGINYYCTRIFHYMLLLDNIDDDLWSDDAEVWQISATSLIDKPERE